FNSHADHAWKKTAQPCNRTAQCGYGVRLTGAPARDSLVRAVAGWQAIAPRLKSPGGGVTGVRRVGAEDSGLDGARKMPPERGVRLGDLLQSRFDRLGEVLAGPLGTGGRPPISPTEAEGPSELVGDELDLLLGSGYPPKVVKRPGLFQLAPEVAQAVSVLDLGLGVEHRSCVSEPRVADVKLGSPRGGQGGRSFHSAVDGGHDLGNMAFLVRI